MVLMEYNLKDFVRRLPIIILEDTIIHPLMYDIIKIMMKVSEEHQVSKEDVSLMLTVVSDISRVKIRDQIDQRLIKQYDSQKPSRKLSPKADSMIAACRIRAKYGGMRDDMQMLWDYAKMWSVRFHQDEQYWLDFLDYHYPASTPIKPNTIGTLKKEDVLNEAVDFHCSGITSILLKKQSIQFQIYRIFGKANPRDVINDLIWTLRSSVNKRKIFWDETAPVDLIDRLDQKTRKKYLELYQIIEPELESISRWHIKKTREVES